MPFQLAGQGLIARRLAQSQYSQATLSKSGARLSWKTLSLWQPCFAAGHRGQRRGLRQGTRGTGHGIGGAPTPKQQGQLENFVDYLLECGKRMNLTAVKTRERAFDVLVEDSIALLPVLEDAVNSVVAGGKIRIMDVGSGAGIPGVVLAIMRPEWQVVLLDSSQKRCDFVGSACKHCARHPQYCGGQGSSRRHWEDN
ncbi:unnamed protein product [Ostreobium quekettii]|uniref:Uncharacterized protein n=1 Tax=Ostreobium quekettii TaxID=121088 RepID=A0A8S1IWN6_9CHLO|nr:unnamed protein product [Ostreobium quekettii]|eukprot:evm.model.scf_129.4 EVM.evm.TU.scf_129.4   scf_129:37031-39129(+)